VSVTVCYVVVVKAMDAHSENQGAITAQNPYCTVVPRHSPPVQFPVLRSVPSQ